MIISCNLWLILWIWKVWARFAQACILSMDIGKVQSTILIGLVELTRNSFHLLILKFNMFLKIHLVQSITTYILHFLIKNMMLCMIHGTNNDIKIVQFTHNMVVEVHNQWFWACLEEMKSYILHKKGVNPYQEIQNLFLQAVVLQCFGFDCTPYHYQWYVLHH